MSGNQTHIICVNFLFSETCDRMHALQTAFLTHEGEKVLNKKVVPHYQTCYAFNLLRIKIKKLKNPACHIFVIIMS